MGTFEPGAGRGVFASKNSRPVPQNYNYLFNYGPSGFAPGPLQAGQVAVTQEEYLAIATAAIREVWARYPGGIYEVRRLGDAARVTRKLAFTCLVPSTSCSLMPDLV